MSHIIEGLNEAQPPADPIRVALSSGRSAAISFDNTSNAWQIADGDGTVVATLRKGLSGTWHVMGGIHPGYSHNLQTTITEWLNLNDELL